MPNATTYRVSNVIAPVIAEDGFCLWGVEWIIESNRHILRVYIDKPQGVSLADCEHISHRLSVLLDEKSVIKEEYVLEVSSPGINRQLFSAEHYSRYVGCEVNIKLYVNFDGRRNYRGLIKAVDGDHIVLQCRGQEYHFTLKQIAKAYLIG